MPAKPKSSSGHSGRGPAPGRPGGAGAWLPWPTALALCRLDLRPPSHGRVFLAVALTSARYGGGEARLRIADLARMTGLSTRTVKSAVAKLIDRGLLARVGRFGRLKVVVDAVEEAARGAGRLAPPDGESAGERGADKLAPPRCRKNCTSPTGIQVSSSRMKCGEGGFTPKQAALVADVLAEATELLGSDAAELALPDPLAIQLGLRPPVTYRRAIDFVAPACDRAKARDLTAAVLALRRDERVQGWELSADAGFDRTAESTSSCDPSGGGA